MSWDRSLRAKASAEFEVEEIVGKQRPRTVRRGGMVRTYTPRKTLDAERRIADEWAAQVGDGFSGYQGLAEVRIETSRQLFRSNPKYWAGRADTGKPDVDNICKTVLDALNGVAYSDDARVVSCTVKKGARTPYGSGNRIRIEISYWDETNTKD
jgi:Holliday junction resolvase RusA-like endonuclease